jgi:DNA invertase Pin-like site-specific DNA recombinase
MTAKVTPITAATPIRAAAISRVSLDIQKDNYSLAAQKTRILELSAKHGVTVPEELLLDDGGYSGTNFNRPQFKRVLKLVRDGEVGAVVFPYVDRFARCVEPGLAMIRQIREAGAKVILGEIGEVTDEAHVKLMLAMLLALAESQRDSIVMKSKAGVAQMVRDGVPFCSRSPYGYHVVTKLEDAAEAIRRNEPVPAGKHKSRFVRVESEIETLKLMGRLALDGATLGSIARELTDRGVPTGQGAKKWSSAVVQGIMKRELNSTGLWSYSKRGQVKVSDPDRWRRKDGGEKKHYSWRAKPRSEWLDLPLPGGSVWTPDEHRRILEALKKNGRAKVGKPAAANGREAVLKSLVVCRLCGKAVAPISRTRPDGRRDAWYKCSNRDRTYGNHLCEAKSIRASLLEDAVWDAWRDAFTADGLRALVRKYIGELQESAGSSDAAALRVRRAKLAKTRQNAMNDRMEADTREDREFYAARIEELRGQIDSLDRRIRAAEAEVPAVDYDGIMRNVVSVRNSTDPKTRRAVLLEFVKRLEWAGDEADMLLRVPVANHQSDESRSGARHAPLTGDGNSRRHRRIPRPSVAATAYGGGGAGSGRRRYRSRHRVAGSARIVGGAASVPGQQSGRSESGYACGPVYARIECAQLHFVRSRPGDALVSAGCFKLSQRRGTWQCAGWVSVVSP